MSMEIIAAIREAELQAERIKKQSLDDARQIVAEANNQGYKLMEQTIEEAEKESADLIKKAEKSAEDEIRKLKSIVDEECAEIKQHAMKKIDMASARIVERVVNFHGNS